MPDEDKIPTAQHSHLLYYAHMQLRAAPRSHILYTIAIIGFIFTLHSAIPIYSNSSFLSLFADERTIGYIYMIGSAVSICGFLIMPRIIRRVGNYIASISLTLLQIGVLYGLVSATSPITLSVLFVMQMAIISMIGLTLDIFLEVYTDGQKAGAIRGFYTATLNASWLIAPLIGSMLIGSSGAYRNTYVAALAMLFPFLYLIYRNFPRFKDPNYIHLSPWQLIKHISSNKNWVKLFFANTILQTFYAWMVVYIPIYLHTTIGFNWEEIGIILTVMLLPFVLIQYPLGRLADLKYGEKEMMAIGFAILGLTTIFLPLITVRSVAVWAFALLVTRIGAAMAEIMIEVYFFKTVSARDSSVLGSFRVTRPLSYFTAPLVTMVGLYFTTNQYLFVIIGMVVLVAVYPALRIKDTDGR